MRIASLFLSLLSTITFGSTAIGAVSTLESYSHEVKEGPYKVKYLILSKEPKFTENPEIIMAYANQWEGILNPAHSAYPETKDLKGLSETKAKELFGKPVRVEGKKSFFDLYIVKYITDADLSDKLELEVEFQDDKILSYILRGKLIGERDRRYPNTVGLPFKGCEPSGPKILAVLREYQQKHGVPMPMDLQPKVRVVGRSRFGGALYDIPEP